MCVIGSSVPYQYIPDIPDFNFPSPAPVNSTYGTVLSTYGTFDIWGALLVLVCVALAPLFTILISAGYSGSIPGRPPAVEVGCTIFPDAALSTTGGESVVVGTEGMEIIMETVGAAATSMVAEVEFVAGDVVLL